MALCPSEVLPVSKPHRPQAPPPPNAQEFSHQELATVGFQILQDSSAENYFLLIKLQKERGGKITEVLLGGLHSFTQKSRKSPPLIRGRGASFSPANDLPLALPAAVLASILDEAPAICRSKASL